MSPAAAAVQICDDVISPRAEEECASGNSFQGPDREYSDTKGRGWFLTPVKDAMTLRRWECTR